MYVNAPVREPVQPRKMMETPAAPIQNSRNFFEVSLSTSHVMSAVMGET